MKVGDFLLRQNDYIADKTYQRPANVEKFLEYNLQFHIMKDYDDERVRMIFSRLQRGKPLNLGERLNAKPGKIVETMRNLASHNFISKSI